MKTKSKMSAEFVKWLKAKKFTPDSFAIRIGISRNTVVKWVYNGCRPRPFVRNHLRSRWPDCPVFAD